jgi:hypothetical protein
VNRLEASKEVCQQFIELPIDFLIQLIRVMAIKSIKHCDGLFVNCYFKLPRLYFNQTYITKLH